MAHHRVSSSTRAVSLARASCRERHDRGGPLPRLALRSSGRGVRGDRAIGRHAGDATRADRDGRGRRIDPPVAAAPPLDIARRARDAARLRLLPPPARLRPERRHDGRSRAPLRPSRGRAVGAAGGGPGGRRRPRPGQPRTAGHRARLPRPGDAPCRHDRVPVRPGGGGALMPLESPNLDDRTWRDLVDSATARIRQEAPEWSDLSPGDPGVVLLEVFAYLTESLLYRLNRVPDKLFIEFLRLIGVRLQPPAAAEVSLVFTRERGTTASVDIPRGTYVTIARPGGKKTDTHHTTPATKNYNNNENIYSEKISIVSINKVLLSFYFLFFVFFFFFFF